MKFTLSWLKDFLATDANVEEIVVGLTSIGLEVEEVVDYGKTLENFIIAEILEASRHPGADNLQCLKVDNGKEILDIVCGAPNARKGIKVVLAPIGAVIPTNGLKIKSSKIRGELSNGMLCSASELGISAIMEDNGGIIELAPDAPLGQGFAEYYGLNDPVIEIAVTPNRGDCLGVYGVARDLSAAGYGAFKTVNIPSLIDNQKSSPIKVDIKHPGCSKFVGYYIEGVTNKSVPSWLKKRLAMIGINSISALVDITNYLCFTFGQPMHAYDAAKIGDLTVEMSSKENFLALNQQEYELDDNSLAIKSEGKVAALAGVIGGVDSGCSVATEAIFLEVAHFAANLVAYTGRKYKIDTDSRHRFERKTNREFVEDVAKIAVAMIIEICGGQLFKPVIVESGKPIVLPEIKFSSEQFEKLSGFSLSLAEIKQYLTAVGCDIKTSNEGIKVTPPAWRQDITLSEDLSEEVLRLYGYDKIPSLPLPVTNEQTLAVNQPEKRKIIARRMLASLGLHEIVSWSFCSVETSQEWIEQSELIELANPLNQDFAVMRPSIIPNLLSAISKALKRGFDYGGFFEIGPIFARSYPYFQQEVITILRYGKMAPRNHYGNREVDFYDLKNDVYSCLQAFGFPVGNLQIVEDDAYGYHPARTAKFMIGKECIARVGELHPELNERFEIKAKLVAAEIYLEKLFPTKNKYGFKGHIELVNQPAVRRDFAFVISKEQTIGVLIQKLYNIDKNLIQDIKLFDIYTGDKLDSGEKSVAIEVTLLAKDHTLTDNEIQAISQKLIDEISAAGGKLRG